MTIARLRLRQSVVDCSSQRWAQERMRVLKEMLGCRVLYVGAYVIAGYGVVVEGGWFEQGGGEVSLELERTTARERIDMWLGLNRRKKARLLFIEIAVRH